MSSTHRITGAMADGRFGADYRSSCMLNSKLRQDFDVKSWDNTLYRTKMQADGLRAMRSMHEAEPCGPIACADLGAAVSPAQHLSDDALSAYTPQPSGAPLQFQ